MKRDIVAYKICEKVKEVGDRCAILTYYYITSCSTPIPVSE